MKEWSFYIKQNIVFVEICGEIWYFDTLQIVIQH